ncbi:serine/threonine-protein phosphatase [Candidatus Woesearchaeota archaeon]|nr:serine/threonine-protein phosphatase [Candidatus Woesearchaeota archaeon]
MAYEIIQASVIGKQKRGRGKENEDTVLVDRKRNIYLLADGVGGHSYPKKASYLACQAAYFELKSLYSHLKKKKFDLKRIPEFMKDIFYKANELISIKDNPDETCMGTTLDACIIHEDVAYWAHAGNGRIYKFNREGKLVKLTKEHVTYEEDTKKCSPAEQAVIEARLGLDSYIGCGADIEVDAGIEPIKPGEILLIEDDGLSHTVSENERVHALKMFHIARNTLLAFSENPNEIAEAHARLELSEKDENAEGYDEKFRKQKEKSRKELGGMDNTSFIAIRRGI